MIKIFYILFFVTISLTSAIWSKPLKYQLECKQYLLDFSRDSLLAQMGIKEKTGHNDGECEKYQKLFGLKNQPYCAMGQYWCFWVNAYSLKDIPLIKSALAQAHFNYAKKSGVQVPYRPDVDDLIVWGYSGKSSGHIERVTEVLASGFVKTAGFNTSNGKAGSQREGNGNFLRIRHLYNPVGLMLVKGLVGFKSNKNYELKGCCYE